MLQLTTEEFYVHNIFNGTQYDKNCYFASVNLTSNYITLHVFQGEQIEI